MYIVTLATHLVARALSGLRCCLCMSLTAGDGSNSNDGVRAAELQTIEARLLKKKQEISQDSQDEVIDMVYGLSLLSVSAIDNYSRHIR